MYVFPVGQLTVRERVEHDGVGKPVDRDRLRVGRDGQRPVAVDPAGASGTGNGTVQFSVAANSDTTPRTGTLTVGGLTFTVTQAAAPPPTCSITLSESALSIGAQTVDSSVGVTASSQSCAWAATANVPWLSISAGASGTGNGTVQFSVAANNDTTPRTGTLTVGGLTFTVTQAAAPPPTCSITLSESAALHRCADGRQFSRRHCLEPELRVGRDGRRPVAIDHRRRLGDRQRHGAVLRGRQHDTTPRTGTLTVAGLTFTVTQAAAPPPTCSITLSESALSIGAPKADRSVDVTASSQSCAWTASSDVPWMTIKGAASGTGNGQVTVHMDANPDHSPRIGTLTISGQTVTVTQDGKP